MGLIAENLPGFMFRPGGRKRAIVAALVAAILSGCAAPGKMAGREPFHIDVVTVRMAPDLGTTTAFAERLQSAVLEASTLWGERGAAKRVVLSIKRYHIQRPGRVLVHGDGSLAEGWAVVIDRATGRTEAAVEVLGVVPHAIGARGVGWTVNRDVEESGMASALAKDLLLKLRGPAALEILERRVTEARRRLPDRADAPAVWKDPSPPRSDWDLGGEMGCLAALDRRLSGDRSVTALPPDCRVLGYRLPGG